MKDMANRKDSKVLSFLFQNRRRNLVFALSTLVVAVVAPFKSYITQWLIDAGSIDAAMRSLVLGIGIILLSHVTEYISRQSFAGMSKESLAMQNCLSAMARPASRFTT